MASLKCVNVISPWNLIHRVCNRYLGYISDASVVIPAPRPQTVPARPLLAGGEGGDSYLPNAAITR